MLVQIISSRNAGVVTLLRIALTVAVFTLADAAAGLLGVSSNILGTIGLRELRELLADQPVHIEEVENITSVSGAYLKLHVEEIDISSSSGSVLRFGPNGIDAQIGSSLWNFLTTESYSAYHHNGNQVLKVDTPGHGLSIEVSAPLYIRELWTERAGSELSLVNLCKTDRQLSNLSPIEVEACGRDMRMNHFSEVAKVEYISKILLAMVSALHAQRSNILHVQEQSSIPKETLSAIEYQLESIQRNMSVIEGRIERLGNTEALTQIQAQHNQSIVGIHELEHRFVIQNNTIFDKMASSQELIFHQIEAVKAYTAAQSTGTESLLNQSLHNINNAQSNNLKAFNESLQLINMQILSDQAKTTSSIEQVVNKTDMLVDVLNTTVSEMERELLDRLSFTVEENRARVLTSVNETYSLLLGRIDMVEGDSKIALSALNSSVDSRLRDINTALHTYDDLTTSQQHLSESLLQIEQTVQQLHDNLSANVSHSAQQTATLQFAVDALTVNITEIGVSLGDKFADFANGLSNWAQQHEENTSAAIAVSNSILAKAINEVNSTTHLVRDDVQTYLDSFNQSIEQRLLNSSTEHANELQTIQKQHTNSLLDIEATQNHNILLLNESLRMKWAVMDDDITNKVLEFRTELTTALMELQRLNTSTEATMIDVIAAIEEVDSSNKEILAAVNSSTEGRLVLLQEQAHTHYQQLQDDYNRTLLTTAEEHAYMNESILNLQSHIMQLSNGSSNLSNQLQIINSSWWESYEADKQLLELHRQIFEHNSSAAITTLQESAALIQSRVNEVETAFQDELKFTNDSIYAHVVEAGENITLAIGTLNDSITAVTLQQKEDRDAYFNGTAAVVDQLMQLEEAIRFNISETSAIYAANTSLLMGIVQKNEDVLFKVDQRLNDSVSSYSEERDKQLLRLEQLEELQSVDKATAISALENLTVVISDMRQEFDSSIVTVKEEVRSSATEFEDLLAESLVQHDVTVTQLNASLIASDASILKEVTGRISEVNTTLVALADALDALHTNHSVFAKHSQDTLEKISQDIVGREHALTVNIEAVNSSSIAALNQLTKVVIDNNTAMQDTISTAAQDFEQLLSTRLSESSHELRELINSDRVEVNKSLTNIEAHITEASVHLSKDIEILRINHTNVAAATDREVNNLSASITAVNDQLLESSSNLRSEINKLSETQKEDFAQATQEQRLIAESLQSLSAAFDKEVATNAVRISNEESTRREEHSALSRASELMRSDVQSLLVQVEVGNTRIEALRNDSQLLLQTLHTTEDRVSATERSVVEIASTAQHVNSQHQLLASEVQNITLRLLPDVFTALGEAQALVAITTERQSQLDTILETSTESLKSIINDAAQETLEKHLMVSTKLQRLEEDHTALLNRVDTVEHSDVDTMIRITLIEANHSSTLNGVTEKLEAVSAEQQQQVHMSANQSAALESRIMMLEQQQSSDREQFTTELLRFQNIVNSLELKLHQANATVEKQQQQIAILRDENKRLEQVSARHDVVEQMRQTIQEMQTSIFNYAANMLQVCSQQQQQQQQHHSHNNMRDQQQQQQQRSEFGESFILEAEKYLNQMKPVPQMDEITQNSSPSRKAQHT